MPTNWPPATAPAWPPAEISDTWLSSADLQNLIQTLTDAGFTQTAPTAAENNLFFKNARCDHGHPVIGRIIVSPGGTRYPFAACNNSGHRDLLVLWPPYYAGFGSGVE